MTTRFCPYGQHWLPPDRFRVSDGGMARDCKACEATRRRMNLHPELRRNAEAARFPGVDIDAIHFKLGAVRKGYRRGT